MSKIHWLNSLEYAISTAFLKIADGAAQRLGVPAFYNAQPDMLKQLRPDLCSITTARG